MKTHDQIVDEARARIIWGDDSIEVYTWIRELGVPEKLATEMIREFARERMIEIRTSGIRKMLTGSLLLLGGGALMWFMFSLYFGRQMVSSVAAVMILFGAYQLTVGFFRLFSGREHGAISDLD